jgi:hypothetical protein
MSRAKLQREELRIQREIAGWQRVADAAKPKPQPAEPEKDPNATSERPNS